MKRGLAAFTLAEMIVAMAVLTLLILLVTQIFNSVAVITTEGNKHMDADAQARVLLDRMGIDLAQMIKRSDVDYYLKSFVNAQIGNDQIAFYSMVPGYYPPNGSQSPVSLVAYRVNAQYQVERMAKGLLWNGVSPGSTPIVFLPSTIEGSWLAATNANSDSDYELIAPDLFRFEYFYLLKNGTLSDTPWDTTAGHTSVTGMQDVAAISVLVAAIDPKSRALVSDSQLTSLAARMNDFSASMRPGELVGQWQTALNRPADIPRPAISAIRIYGRYFYLVPKL
jgi:hypothetical protein